MSSLFVVNDSKGGGGGGVINNVSKHLLGIRSDTDTNFPCCSKCLGRKSFLGELKYLKFAWGGGGGADPGCHFCLNFPFPVFVL